MVASPRIAIYPGAAHAWDDLYLCRVQAEQWELDETKQLIETQVVELIKRHSGQSGNILDIGCGNGRFAGCCSYQRYLGIDQASAMITLAREAHSSENVLFLEAPAFSFRIADYFDTGILIHVTQHVEEPYVFLEQLDRFYNVGVWIFTMLVTPRSEPEELNIEDSIAARALPREEVLSKILEMFEVEEMVELPGVGVEEVTELLFVGRRHA